MKKQATIRQATSADAQSILALIKELAVHFHEGLEHIIDKRNYWLIPVFFGDAVECWEHDVEDDIGVLLYEAHNVFIVPVV